MEIKRITPPPQEDTIELRLSLHEARAVKFALSSLRRSRYDADIFAKGHAHYGDTVLRVDLRMAACDIHWGTEIEL